MKRTVPLIITFIVGTLLIVAAFVPHYPFDKWNNDFNEFFNIIQAFAFILGGANLMRMHGRRLVERGAGAFYSGVCLAGFLGMMTVGLFKLGNPAGLTGDVDVTGSWFEIGYRYLFSPTSATIYALLAFFIASASYRAFRAKNTEASLLLVTAMVILLGRTFLGPVLTGWLPPSLSFFEISNLASWFMSVPVQAGNRAIMLGVALGIVSLSLKVILAIDRSHLGDRG